MEDVFDTNLVAQQEALLQSLECSNKRQRRRTAEEREDEAILKLALEESRKSHQAIESEKLAKRLHLEELEEADQEFAKVLETSEQEAHQIKTYEALTVAKVAQSQDRHKGSWECPRCTFTNPPFEPQCRACHSPAPTHALVFREIPDMHFGLEIEILVQDGKRDGFTLESIAQSLSQLGPIAVRFEGYSHETTNHWKIVPDSSIHGADDDLCFELVSPVLQGSKGLAELRDIMDNVRRLGIATNASCGFHVHVDATPGSSQYLGSVRTLRRMAQCFVALENAFDLIVTQNDRRANSNQYCGSNRLEFGSRSNAQRWEIIGDVKCREDLVKWLNPDRYRKLNLTNLLNRDRPSTCEFRQHGGVEDLLHAEAWVRLILCFCQNAVLSDNDYTKCLLPERASVQEEVRALFDLVDCQGLEQFFVVESRLFDQNNLHNKWSCRKCRRVFTTSRSLSQHAAATGH